MTAEEQFDLALEFLHGKTIRQLARKHKLTRPQVEQIIRELMR